MKYVVVVFPIRGNGQKVDMRNENDTQRSKIGQKKKVKTFSRVFSLMHIFLSFGSGFNY